MPLHLPLRQQPVRSAPDRTLIRLPWVRSLDSSGGSDPRAVSTPLVHDETLDDHRRAA